MPIDPSIPLQVKPFNIELPVNQLAAAGEAMKLGEMQRGAEEQNRLNEYLKSGVDLSSPEGRRGLVNYGKTGLGYAKALGEQEKLGLETKKLGVETKLKQMDVQREQFANLVFNPSNANVTAHIEDSVLKNEIPPEQAQQMLQKVMGMNLDQRKQFFTEMGMKAAERAQLAETKRGHDLTYGATIRGQNMQYNPELQGKIAESRKLGEARAETAVAPTKDIQANLKALKSAGYDPVTGKDDVSSLIAKSTGSYAGAATDLAGRVVGYAPEGAKAIKTLETYASNMTTQLLGGKLGAGISNADRDFIVAGLGDVANPTVPTESRLAAWNAVKERMRVAGMVPPPKGEGETAAPATTKAGASVSNW